jgi:hypothetical protein
MICLHVLPKRLACMSCFHERLKASSYMSTPQDVEARRRSSCSKEASKSFYASFMKARHASVLLTCLASTPCFYVLLSCLAHASSLHVLLTCPPLCLTCPPYMSSFMSCLYAAQGEKRVPSNANSQIDKENVRNVLQRGQQVPLPLLQPPLFSVLSASSIIALRSLHPCVELGWNRSKRRYGVKEGWASFPDWSKVWGGLDWA